MDTQEIWQEWHLEGYLERIKTTFRKLDRQRSPARVTLIPPGSFLNSQRSLDLCFTCPLLFWTNLSTCFNGVVSTDSGTEVDIVRSITSARSVFISYLNTKIKLSSTLVFFFCCYVESDHPLSRCLSCMIGVPWTDTISKGEIGRCTGLSPVRDEIGTQLGDNCTAGSTMQWNPHSQEGQRLDRLKNT